METLKRLLARGSGLEERVAALEVEVQEGRALNLRLAELTDVLMELVLPAADRDDAEVERILEQYRRDTGDPLKWRP